MILQFATPPRASSSRSSFYQPYFHTENIIKINLESSFFNGTKHRSFSRKSRVGRVSVELVAGAEIFAGAAEDHAVDRLVHVRVLCRHSKPIVVSVKPIVFNTNSVDFRVKFVVFSVKIVISRVKYLERLIELRLRARAERVPLVGAVEGDAAAGVVLVHLDALPLVPGLRIDGSTLAARGPGHYQFSSRAPRREMRRVGGVATDAQCDAQA